MSEELEERIRQAERIPGFREFLEQQTYRKGDCTGYQCDQREIIDIDIDTRRGVVGCLFQRCRYAAGLRYWIDVGTFRGSRGAVAGEILVQARSKYVPDFDDFTRLYDRVKIAEITDDRVKVKAIAEREGGRTDEFEFEL